MAKESKDQKVIDLRKKVKVKGTEKNPHVETGKVLEVHPMAAEAGIKIGYYEKAEKEK